MWVEQALALDFVVAQEVSSEHGIQQNFFSACPPPAIKVPNQHWLNELPLLVEMAEKKIKQNSN